MNLIHDPVSLQLQRSRRRQGFTLVEVLVVMVIVGLSLSLVIPALPQATPAQRQAEAAALLLARVEHAAELATLTGTAMGVQLRQQGYRFLALESRSGQWRPYAQTPLKSVRLMPDLQLRLTVEGRPVALPAAGFDAEPRRTADAVAAAREAQLRPQFILLPGGEVTPSLVLELVAGEVVPRRLALNRDGRLAWQGSP